MKLYKTFFKRPMDLILSSVSLVVLSPVIAVTAYSVRRKLGSPVFFKQKRIGRDDREFELYKFRSMTDATDADGRLLPDDVRLTSFGKKLRSTSLDELPSLLNIVKGDMSIVGPRPLLTSYLPLYNDFQKRRHEVRPGLTGLAQVNGRNATTWKERFNNDIKYVDNITFLNDVKIILRTFGKVFRREDINSSESITMKLFSGNES